MTDINKMLTFYDNKYYKTINDKRRRPIYNYKGTYTNAFKQLIKSNEIDLPSNLLYVYNPNTNRFISKSKLLDNRHKQQVIKKKFKYQFVIVNNKVKHIPTSMHISYWIEELDTQIKNKKAPIEIILKSANIYNAQKIFKFNNFYHFESFINNILEGDYEGGSGGTTGTIKHDYNVFSNSVLEWKYIKGGCNKCSTSKGYEPTTFKTIESGKWIINLFNPISQRNDCGIKCVEHILGLNLKSSVVRKQFKLLPNTKLSPEQVLQIYNTYNDSKKYLSIIDTMFENNYCPNVNNYILYEKGHYYVVQSMESKPHKDIQTKRGDLAFDFETRPDFEQRIMIGNSIAYKQRDTICCIYYNDYKSKEKHKLTFVSNEHKSSARQFLNWLQQQHYNNKHYNIIAHNGANFDFYFLLGVFSKQEQIETDIQLRGYSIIGMQYYSNLFKDPCCFLTNSLDNLCKSFKVKTPKLTEFNYNGKILDNKTLCFYKPELSYWEFLELQHKEHEYWTIYEEYCLVDCISLAEIWKSFTNETNVIIGKMGEWLQRKCNAKSCNTIGSLSKKLVVNLNNYIDKPKWYFKKYLQFIDNNIDKYKFICEFKRGGISHCNQAGKHNHRITSYDITSQYPTSMIHMKVPSGYSRWVNTYDESKFGYYLIKNLKFREGSHKFLPIPLAMKTKSLQWKHSWKHNDEVHVGSEMIKYLMNHWGLVSFEVIKGLVSNEFVYGEQLFGKYVNTLFEEKAKQDVLKEMKSEEYNPAFREVIKLFLNSVSGKLVEDPSKYFSLEYTLDTNAKTLNGIGIKKDYQETINEWVGCGVCVYEYSKILLFKYVECLPNKSDDVIHIETDSIYFNGKHNETFIRNISKLNKDTNYPINIGSSLGNVKKEHDTNISSYFLGKKFYYLKDGEEELCKIKGIPVKTIDKHGNTQRIVDRSFYENIYNGESITSEFATLRKNLYDKCGSCIYSLRMTRTTKPNMEYIEYNE